MRDNERNLSIASDYEAGDRVEEIAARYFVSPSQVYTLLHRARVVMRRSGWRGDSEGHRRAAEQGGLVTSQDRAFMAAIGRKGGTKTSEDREHMVKIGRKGGLVKAGRVD